MRPDDPDEAARARRWADFRRRAAHAPGDLYRHRARGWEYIPVHPFGDDPDVLRHLGLSPADCKSVDAWWGIDGDAVLLESRTAAAGDAPGLFAMPTPDPVWPVGLVAVFAVPPPVTRQMFEAVMANFADAGFPRGSRFRLTTGDQWVSVTAAPDVPRISFAEARARAADALWAGRVVRDGATVDRLVILDERTRDVGVGWVFEYESETYLRTGDVMRHKLLAAPPLLVTKEGGDVVRLNGADTIERSIEVWLRERDGGR